MAEKHLRSLLISAFAGLTLVVGSGTTRAQDEHACGSLHTHYGPFDFRRTTPLNREIVERAHFDRGVETLTRGLTGPFGGDIWYTLAAYPNHPRALQAMERLAQKEKKDPPTNSRYTVECLYERAIRFQKDDHVVRMLYANFLFKRGDTERALKQMDYVVSTTPEDPLAQFNAGMLYVDMKAYDKGLEQAHKVMAMGFTRRELKDRLAAVGRWVEPRPEAAASAASAAASSASAAR